MVQVWVGVVKRTVPVPVCLVGVGAAIDCQCFWVAVSANDGTRLGPDPIGIAIAMNVQKSLSGAVAAFLFCGMPTTTPATSWTPLRASQIFSWPFPW